MKTTGRDGFRRGKAFGNAALAMIVATPANHRTVYPQRNSVIAAPVDAANQAEIGRGVALPPVITSPACRNRLSRRSGPDKRGKEARDQMLGLGQYCLYGLRDKTQGFLATRKPRGPM